MQFESKTPCPKLSSMVQNGSPADAYRSENENENGLFWAFPFPFSLKPKLMADGK
jgi:hypothetical protein